MKFSLILMTLALSLNVHAIEAPTNTGKFTSGGSGGGTVTGGGGGGSSSGGGGTGVGVAVGVELNLDPVSGEAPQYGVSSVKPTSDGKCQVIGYGTAPWPGSPCEGIYGPNPNSTSTSNGSIGVSSKK